jgi:hypothetical protein
MKIELEKITDGVTKKYVVIKTTEQGTSIIRITDDYPFALETYNNVIYRAKNPLPEKESRFRSEILMSEEI